MPPRSKSRARGYRKRITSEEEREGYVLVLKDRLGYFPRLRQAFAVTKGNQRGTVSVQSYDCLCRGPARPHEHYFLRWPALKIGDEVEITRTGEGQYRLQVLAPQGSGAKSVKVQGGGL